MGKVEKFISFIILLVLIVLLAVLFKRLYTPQEVVKTYQVAVIMDNSAEEYWKYIMLGAEKAGIDNNMDLRFVGMYVDMTEGEQLSYIEREIENKVDAIVLAPINSQALELWLEEKKISIPIISLGEEINSQKVIKHISVDNYTMGEHLAEVLAKDAPQETSYIFYPHGAVGGIEERYNGLINKLRELRIAYETVYVNREDLEYGNLYAASMDPSGSAIGLIPEITEQLSEAFGEDRRVYGVGITDNILRGLEKGSISKVIAQSDYDAGYLSINWLYGYLEEKKNEEVFLEIYEVDKNNMFTMPLEQILFPIS
ncbi:sugar ABC transporter substrate-binding protein [Alloiococcus sp. CFN-8]|uniref:sugar ABC transporter substrate-binding protein n=1 Tax=Alloiococcus sp. CFN-8 TaxID=3416081 RepID=UPI003CF422C0